MTIGVYALRATAAINTSLLEHEADIAERQEPLPAPSDASIRDLSTRLRKAALAARVFAPDTQQFCA